MEKIIAGISACIIAGLVQFQDSSLEPRQIYFPPPKIFKQFTFGYDDTIADIYWLTIIQNYQTCEMNLAPKEIRADWSIPATERPPNCRLGYVYRLFDLVTEIAPKFDLPFKYGGLVLSVLIDDREGADLIFRKAVARDPNDWHLHYEHGFHLMHEMTDYGAAAEAYEKAAKLGAPKWVYALAARLYTKTGRAQISKNILEEMLKKSKEDFKGRERLENRLKEANEVLANATNEEQLETRERQNIKLKKDVGKVQK